MRALFGFDTETFPIRPGRQAPRIVCGQSRAGGIELRERFLDRLEAALNDPRVLLYGHEIAFDACASIASRPRLLRLWFDAYAADRVTCTHEREKLIRIAEGTLVRYGKNNLLALVHRYHLQHDFKDGDKEKGGDAWRARYFELDGIDPALWPEDARRYALADLIVDDVFAAQETAPAAWLDDQFRQARAAFWLKLTSAHGMMVDGEAVAALAERLEVEHAIVRNLLIVGGTEALFKFLDRWQSDHPDANPLPPPLEDYHGGLVRPNGSKDTKAAAARMRAVCASKNLPIPITDTGKERAEKTGEDPQVVAQIYTALDADSCLATGDPLLIAYARYTSVTTLRGRVERLRIAASWGLPIQPHFDALKETGRTSASKGETKPGRPVMAFGDQTQNLQRAPGLRECYRARRGYLILSCDWKAAELHTLAQCCIDLGLESKLAAVLNAGQDPHIWYACQLNGWAYEWADEALHHKHGHAAYKAVKKARQDAKPCNFGFPGGLGIQKFRLFAAKQYQVFFSDQEATDRKGIWLGAFDEMPLYFRHINELIESGAPLVHFRSNRYRGDIRYTSAANSYFQGRCADMLKDAGFRLAREFYVDGLPGWIWNEAHDELLCEIPEDCASEVSARVQTIMEDVGREWCPGAPVKAEPALQHTWRKGAEPAYRDGKLIPHEDRDFPDLAKEAQKLLDKGETVLYCSWVLGVQPSRILEAIAC